MIRALVLLLVLLGGCSGDTSHPPNVIVIVMDTARGDRCSLNGYGRKTTPFLDELARTSTTFTDAWSPSPWTGPAHASLFTGLRPEHHGFMSRVRFFLTGESVTLAEILSDAGYATACLTNNSHISNAYGLVQGFRDYGARWLQPDQSYPSAAWTHRIAVEWVKEKRRKAEPYFLFINHMEPHQPYTPTADAAERFLHPNSKATDEVIDRYRDVWGAGLINYMLGHRKIGERDWEILSRLYDAEIATLDAEIRKLVQELGGIDALDDTIFVVISDHGENLSDHGLADHVFSVHRTVLHVPLLIRYPGKFDGGTRVSSIARTEDVFATILELCGLEAPGEIDGAPLTADLEGRVARAVLGRLNPDHMIRKFDGMDGSRFDTSSTSVCDGRHHLLVHGNGRVELYDVKADPGELENLADESPGAVERLRKLLPVLP